MWFILENIFCFMDIINLHVLKGWWNVCYHLLTNIEFFESAVTFEEERLLSSQQLRCFILTVFVVKIFNFGHFFDGSSVVCDYLEAGGKVTVSGCSCISRGETGVASHPQCHVCAHTEEVSLVLSFKSISSPGFRLIFSQFVKYIVTTLLSVSSEGLQCHGSDFLQTTEFLKAKKGSRVRSSALYLLRLLHVHVVFRSQTSVSISPQCIRAKRLRQVFQRNRGDSRNRVLSVFCSVSRNLRSSWIVDWNKTHQNCSSFFFINFTNMF